MNPYLKIRSKDNELKTIIDLSEVALVEIIKDKYMTLTFKDSKTVSIYFNNTDPSFEKKIIKYIDDYTETE